MIGLRDIALDFSHGANRCAAFAPGQKAVLLTLKRSSAYTSHMNLSEYVAQQGMSQQKAADILGVTQSAVSQWLQWIEDNDRGTKITAERAVLIERATNGDVTRYDLRPDVFGPAPKQKARAA